MSPIISASTNSTDSGLVVGSHMAQAGFRRNIETYHASAAKRVAGWETVDHPNFAEHEREAEPPPAES